MGVMIGILMTGGIVVNHAILYIDRFNARRRETAFFDPTQLTADLQDAGQARLRPILLTTFTTVLGLLPMAMDHGNGAELWRPMAITTIGGLLSSTILTLIVLPDVSVSPCHGVLKGPPKSPSQPATNISRRTSNIPRYFMADSRQRCSTSKRAKVVMTNMHAASSLRRRS